jgi:hypothetical protein
VKTLQRKTGLIIIGIIVALAGCVALSSAQEAKHEPLMGTITLQGGRTIQGDLLLVAFGVTEAARFGSDRREVDEGGKLEINVNGATTAVAGGDIATVAAEWALAARAPGGEPEWHIASLSIATRDGQTITGKPAWFMSMSEFILEPGGGEERVHVENYPLFPASFNPDNLIVKVDLTGAAPTEVPTEETPDVPTTVVPPIELPIPIPVMETPTEETPTEEMPGGVTPDVEVPLVVAPVPPLTGGPRVTQPASLTLTLICPHCGESITVAIDAHAP